MEKFEDQKRYDAIIKSVVMTGDFILLNVLFYYACHYYGGRDEMAFVQSHLLISAVYFAVMIRGGVILHHKKVRNYQIVTLVLRNILLFSLITTSSLYLGNFAMPGWSVYGLFILSLVLAISLWRLFSRRLVKAARRKEWGRSGVILVGSGDNNVALYKELVEDISAGYNVLGYFDERPSGRYPEECPYLGTVSGVTAFLDEHPDQVRNLYCNLPAKYGKEVFSIIKYCERNVVRFYRVLEVGDYRYHKVYFNMMGDVPCLGFYDEPLSWVENRMVKRAFDILFSLAFLCTLFVPVLIVVSIITKITMPGPIFFRQKRNGIYGKEFYCLKFRSMKVNSQADTMQATRNDPRTTRWGSIMRKTNIDELPQFINVLLGDMSVVGPRPHMIKHTEEYSALIDKYMVRHFIKPGVTGWSQINGFRGETKELEQMENRVKGDIWYMEHWNFWLDIYIIYKTVANVIVGEKNAY